MTNDPRLIKLPKGNLPEAWAHRKPWTSKLDSELKKDWQSGMELLPILKKYGRTPIAIFTRLRQLGELSEELNPVELCKAMNSSDETGLWDLTKEVGKWLWGTSKEVGKEAPGVIKFVATEVVPGLAKEVPGLAKETIEGVKKFSKDVGEGMAVEAHKYHLEHIEKMKKLEKNAKDEGISEESLAKLKKDLGVTQEGFGDTQRGFEGSANLLGALENSNFMIIGSIIEERFEEGIEHLLTTRRLKIRNILLNQFINKAAQGKADDQYILGNRYYQGLDGVPQNDEEALKWFKKAAEQGHVEAQNKLGTIYSSRKGDAKSEEEALKWFKKAAEQGHADAQNKLGKSHSIDLFGNGNQKDNEEALKWFKKAAEQGHAEAMCSLGHMYSDGSIKRFYSETVAINIKEAFKWFKKAAEQGHAEAQNTVGYHYAKGIGVTQSDKEAFKWYKKSADQGTESGRHNLSRMSDKVQADAQDEFVATKPKELNKDFGATQSEPRKKITEYLQEHKANRKRSSQEDFNQAKEYSKKGNEKESISKPILSSYFSSLIEKYLSNYQAIERGEILQGNVWPTKGYHNHFREVCRGEKQAVTIHEQAYMEWKKQDRPPQKDSTETTIDIDLP